MAYLVGENGSLSVKLSSDTVGSLVEVPQIISLSWGGLSRAVVDAFGIDSTARTTRPSRLAENGTIEFEMAYDPSIAVHALIKQSWTDGEDLDFSFSLPTDTPTVETGSGYITDLEFSGIEVDGNVTISGSLKVNELA